MKVTFSSILNINQFYKTKLRWSCVHAESKLRVDDLHLANQIHCMSSG